MCDRYYDSYVQAKLKAELSTQAKVLSEISAAAKSVDAKPTAAELLLAEQWLPGSEAAPWRKRAFELAAALDKSLGNGSVWGGMAILQSQDPTLGLATIETPLTDHLCVNPFPSLISPWARQHGSVGLRMK